MLTKVATQEVFDRLWEERANVDFSRSKTVEDRTVDALCRTSLELFEVVGLLQEAAHKAPSSQTYRRLMEEAIRKSKTLLDNGIIATRIPCVCSQGAQCPLHND